MVAAVRMTTTPTRSQSPAHWIATVAEELGTDDFAMAHRVLRTWMWMVKNRLAAPSVAADFAAKLPDSIRYEFFRDGEWFPASVEIRPATYIIRFARNAGIAVQDVRGASAAVTAAMARLLPASAVEDLLDELDPGLQVFIQRRAS